MNEITVVCCYNDEEAFRNFSAELEKQSCPSEIIGINNIGNKNFSSCSSAYNSIANEIKTKFVIYSHQDIRFLEAEAVSKFLAALKNLNPDDILGVAGTRFDNFLLYSNIRQVFNKTGEIIRAGVGCIDSEMIECDTVDECFFGGYAEHFRKFPFDEKICNSWHLYAVEACLRTKAKLKARIFASGIHLLHLSSGTLNYDFYRTFYKLCRFYAKDFPFIRTPCPDSKTRLSSVYRGLWKRTRKEFSRKLKEKFMRVL